MRFLLFILIVAVAGCSSARLREQNAFLAGQNVALRQQQAAQFSGVTVIGPVRNGQVPWVARLTLAQAIATADYQEPKDPREIILTRQGESATVDVTALFNGAVIPLEPGDVIELRP